MDRDWLTDGRYHEKYIRVNHYILRDEKYFKEERLPYSYHKNGMLRLYENSKQQDQTILDFIRKNYPEKYKEIWDQSEPSSHTES